MIIVTGGAGMIGSNTIAALNARGRSDILVVDHLKDGRKMHNLADLDIHDYLDRDDFAARLAAGQDFGAVDGVLHLGACSATTEWDGQFLMRNNYGYSQQVLHWCLARGVRFVYASSAAVYGLGAEGFAERRACERPINMYAYSKFQFDQYLRSLPGGWPARVAGLRYFNVYGPREAHKGAMASVAWHFHQQVLAQGFCEPFAGTPPHGDGGHRRDFVDVQDCVAVNLWLLLERPECAGLFNVGTGQAQSFNDVAHAVLRWHRERRGVAAEIRYRPFPEHLRGAYQAHTEADLTALRAAGYMADFTPVQEGVPRYLDWLAAQGAA